MHVLVIGGTGFIGPHVVTRLLEDGHAVTVYHRGVHEAGLPGAVRHVHHAAAAHPVLYFPPETLIPAPDVVLHMVPIGDADATLAMRTFAGVAKRIVVASSADVYRAYGVFRRTEPGPLEPVPLGERAPPRTELYPYRAAASDREAVEDRYEKILVERAVMGHPLLPSTVLRLPAVYGPGDPQRRLRPYIRRMLDGRAAIPLPALRAAWRWTHDYVENVAAAIALAIVDDTAAERIYNLGEAAAPTLAERVAAIADAAGWRGELVTVPDELVPPDLRDTGHDYRQHLVTDTSRVRAELRFAEPVPAAEALRRTVAWERAHPPAGQDAEPDYAADDALLAAAGKAT